MLVLPSAALTAASAGLVRAERVARRHRQENPAMLYAAYGICWVASVVCFVITLIKLFKEKGLIHGLFGILCGLYTFIWGWMNVAKHNSKTVMLVWTLAIVGSIICAVVLAPETAAAVQG
jgi:hypothetical protein